MKLSELKQNMLTQTRVEQRQEALHVKLVTMEKLLQGMPRADQLHAAISALTALSVSLNSLHTTLQQQGDLLSLQATHLGELLESLQASLPPKPPAGLC